MLSPLTHDDPPGFGPYQLMARLGSGGMGTVYLARSPGGRTVALKTMHRRIAADADFRTRFRLETDAARVIGGQHGAEVVDADPGAETPWLATEYVLGPPLDDAVEGSGPLPEPTVRAVGAALCAALGQLHRSDVVHRDLKPSNIMLTAYGPKLIDFGIARAIGDARLTRTGNTAGTPAFMSPEQASGQEHTPAGDVFALAGVLVFAATGQAAFGWGQAADLLYRVQYTEPDLSAVPAGLAPVLAQALDKDPARRPTTGELAARLHDGGGEFADHLTVPLLTEIGRRAAEVWQFTPARLPAPAGAPPEPVAEPPATGPSRRKMLLMGGGSALAAAAGAGAWVWWGTDGTPYQKPGAGPEVSAPPKKKENSEWQWQVAHEDSEDTAPGAPFVVGDMVAFVAGQGLNAADAASGTIKWQSDALESTYRTATDGKRIYRICEPEEAEGNKGKPGGFPLLVATVGLDDGKTGKAFAEITDVNGVIHMNQLLCAADGVLYLAAGAGEYGVGYKFEDGQSWKLIAVDAGSGRRRWSQPVKGRAQGRERLLFLSAAVAGGRLVLLREQDDGTVRVTVHDAGSGEAVWEKPLDVPRKELDRDPLTTDGDHLYVGGGSLRALRLSSGRETWSTRARGSGSRFGLPSVKDGVVYAVEKGRGVVALDARTGKRAWTEQGGDGARAGTGDRPVIGSAHVYSASPAGLRAIDISSHNTAATYKTRGDRFVAHERAKMIIAFGGRFIAGYPLK
jgi:outer membrane protein assembly factor BamB